MSNLPKEGKGQEIGRLAGRALGNKLPKSWIEKELDGDTDFGIDYLIQLKSSSDDVSYSFYLQLKGTSSPKYNSKKTHISYDFETSTLKYYHQQEPLVMVAVVDLSGNEDELWKCPIYYFWLEDEWFQENKEKLERQKTISIKIPTDQLLEPSLNIYGFYRERISEKLAVSDLKRSIKPQNKDVTGQIKSLASAITERPFLLKSIEEKHDSPWLQNPQGTVANELKKCSEKIAANQLNAANHTLEILEKKIETLSSHELAEFYYQKASILSLKGNDQQAEECYQAAYEKNKRERYLVGYIESKFQYDILPSDSELESIIAMLDDDSYQKCNIKAKCLALLNREEEALHLLKEKHPDKIVAQMIVCTISRVTDKLDQIISDNQTRDFESGKENYLFHALSARRFFDKALGAPPEHGQVLPIQGKPSYNLSLMAKASKFCRKAWDAAKDLGYPSDIYLLIDISILVYGYFDKGAELKKHFEALLDQRPYHPELIRPYSRMLFDHGELIRAVELLGNLESHTPDDIVILFFSYYRQGKSNEAVELLKENESFLLNSKNRQIPSIFCIAADIAHEQIDLELEERYKCIVKQYDSGEALLAIQHFVTSCNAEPSRKNEFSQELYQTYLKLERPVIIAEQLYRYLDAYEQAPATQIIELGEQILSERELTKSDYLHLAQAFLTTKRWLDAQKIAEKNIKKDIDVSQWKLILAAALNHQGKVGVAFDAIKDALKANNVTREFQQFYVNFCLSLGLSDNVIEVVTNLLANTTSKVEKVNLTKALITAYSNNSKYQRECELAVDRFAKLVDQDNCEEEGLFLLYFLTYQKHATEEKVKDFQARLNRYTERFPESPLLKKGSVDIESGAESVMESLNHVLGIDEENIKKWEKNKRAIRNGSLPVPYSLLGNFLRDTNDIFTTWSLSSSLPKEQVEYRVRHADQLPQAKFHEALKRPVILLEETTILFLYEIELLNCVLKTVPSFSLLESVFNKIKYASHQLGGAVNNPTARKILTILQQHIDKLVLVKENATDLIDCYVEALEKHEALLLTEDLYLKHHIKQRHNVVISGNIFNILQVLHSNEQIDEEQYQHKIVDVCNLGVFQPNMSIDVLTNCFVYFVNGVDFRDTRFEIIFDKVFSVSNDSRFCFQLFFKFLNRIGELTDIKSTTLISLFQGFLLRHPLHELSSVVAIWYLSSCSRKTPILNEITHVSEPHHQLWGLYSEIMVRVNATDRMSFEKLVIPVVRELLTLDDETRDKLYQTLKTSFVPMTQQAVTFESVYQQSVYIEKLRSFDRQG